MRSPVHLRPAVNHVKFFAAFIYNERMSETWSWQVVRRDPIKHALVGLVMALLIGFVPAAYYTYGVSGSEVGRIRARQAELSQQPGTPSVLEEFSRLDGDVARVRRRGMIGSAVLWVLVSGLVAAGFFRLVPSDA
jgi:hypothetical protein